MDKKEQQTMFAIFIKSLTNLEGEKRDQFCADLFNCFPSEKIIKASTTHNWILERSIGFTKKISCSTITMEHYLAFVDHLRSEIGIVFEKTKQKLKENASLFEYVDFDTDNSDIFFCSLLKQFLYIINIPVDNNPILDAFISENINKSILENTSKNTDPFVLLDSDTQMKRLFFNALTEYKIPFYLNNFKLILKSLYPCRSEIRRPLYEEMVKENFEQFAVYFSPMHIYSSHMVHTFETTEEIENFPARVTDFQRFIKEKITDTYFPYQNDATYLLIHKFSDELTAYCSIIYMFLDDIVYKLFERWNSNKVEDLLSLCNQKQELIEQEIIKIKNNGVTEELTPSLQALETQSFNLFTFSLVLHNHGKMCSIFEQLFDGRSILY